MAVPMSSKEEFLRQQLLCAQAARDRIRTPDRWTHAEVLALLDEVITELKEEIRMEMPNAGALASAL